MGKNLQKVKDMVDGKFSGHKTQVSMVDDTSVHANRKVGDKWKDSDGVEWEQKEGYRSKVSNLGRHHSWDEKCSDCGQLVIKQYDKATWNRNKRCYGCQTVWEEDLKYEKKNQIGKSGTKWTFWVRLNQLREMDAIDKDMEQLIFTKHDENVSHGTVIDASVANAIANANIKDPLKLK